MYDIKQINNGSLIKDFKNSTNSRGSKNIGPQSFSDLLKASKMERILAWKKKRIRVNH